MPKQPSLSRRSMLRLAAGSAVSLVVSPESAISADGCILTAALTEGPFFVDEKLLRNDIRSDPDTGDIAPGVPLQLRFAVRRFANGECTPLTGAYLDVWHCDAVGVYSDVGGAGSGRKFLRGYQITDADGNAKFTTIYPGWYMGRAVHIHFKLRLLAGATTTYEFTSQFFFNDALTDTVHALSPYRGKGQRDRRNNQDGIYNRLSAAAKTALTLRPTSDASGGYSGTMNLDVRVG